MADERINEATPGVVETTDRGLFDFMKKKEDETKPATSEYDNINSGVEKVHILQPGYKTEDHHHHEEQKHESLGDKLHRSNSSSSSSSDEEGDDEEKKRRRKERKEKKKGGGIKEKIEEKFGGHHKEEHHEHDTNVPIENIHVQENVYSEPSYTTTHAPDHRHHEEEEKKKGGFMDNIKDKLPGQHGDEEHKVAAPVVSHTEEVHRTDEEKEKKGFLDKIKEKIPGLHSKDGAEEKKEHDHREEKKGGY